MPERIAQVLVTALRRQAEPAQPVEVEVTDPETALAVVDSAVLATMYGESPVGIDVLVPRGCYLRINYLIARHNGPTPDEHVGRTLEDVLGESAPAVRAQFERVLASGQAVSGEGVVVADAHGVPRTWQVTWFPARDRGTGRIVATVCIASDVSDARRAEERTRVLARSGELLAAGLRTEQVLDAVVDLLVPAIADWCAVHLVGAGDAIELARAVPHDPQIDLALRRLLDVTPVRRDQEYGAGPAIGQGRTLRMRGIDDAVLERIAG